MESGAAGLECLGVDTETAASTANICHSEAVSRRCRPGAKIAAFVSQNGRVLAWVLGTSVAVGALITTVLVTAHAVGKLPGTQERRQTCDSPACWNISRRLRRSMNASVDPCDDFYAFACQRWDGQQGGPIWQSAADSLKRDFEAAREALLERRFSGGAMDEAEGYLVDFVEHCHNEKPLNTSQGKDPVLEQLDSMGGYPLFTRGWRNCSYCWIKAETRLAHMGYNQALLLARFDTDAKRHNRRVLVIGHQPFMFTQAVLDNVKSVEDIKIFLRDVALRYRDPPAGQEATDLEDVDEQIDEMFNFSRSLVEELGPQSPGPQEPRRMTLKEMLKEIPEIDWIKYIHKLTSFALKAANLPEVGEKDSVLVLNLGALRTLAKFIGNWRHYRAMANYIGYKFLINSVYFSPREGVRETYYNYTAKYNVTFDRMAKCKELSETLGLVTYHHYFRTNRHKFDRQREMAVHMLDQVRAQFNATLKSAAWIDNSTRALLSKKLENVHALVGYTDWLLNATEVHNFYKMGGAPKRDGPFLERLLYHRENRYRQQIEELFSPRKPEIWEDINARTVSAAYNIRDINVKVYAGMLLEPFSYLDVPTYVNYGTVGFVAGHEIIHAFDDRGITIDEHGVDFSTSKWNPTTKKEFDQRMKSLINFYTNHFKVNGSHTRNENLADTSAARFSFKSYRSEPASCTAPALPGFENYTNDQLYFLSFASIWCNNNTYDPNSIYSPNHARVNGPLMNLEEFATTFQCQKGSPMNPSKKAAVWDV